MKRWFLPILAIAVPVAVLVAGRVQAAASPAAAISPPLDTVVLTGSYSCLITEYSQPQPVPRTTDPAPDPIIVHDFSHAISVNGTGGVTAANPPGPRPGSGPGFGGRFGALPAAPLNLGSGIGASFDEGTIEDCRRFGEAIRAVATRLGCDTSQIYSREQTLSYALADVRFSFVCEGRSADQIHAIGELDRSLLLLNPAAAD